MAGDSRESIGFEVGSIRASTAGHAVLSDERTGRSWRSGRFRIGAVVSDVFCRRRVLKFLRSDNDGSSCAWPAESDAALTSGPPKLLEPSGHKPALGRSSASQRG